MYMKTKFKQKKNKKRRTTKKRTLKKDVGRGLFDASLVKDLLIDNVHNRFENPEDIREYTIHPGNKDKILTYMRAKTVNKETVADPILKPVLSKGSKRIINLQEFITKLNNKMELSDDIRAILISQYIILNQVFGDGNHRAGLFVLRNYSSFGEERIQKIMKLTERIHKYDSDLRSRGFWYRMDDIYVPDFSKIDEMLRQ
jgi:hypothetical protein